MQPVGRLLEHIDQLLRNADLFLELAQRALQRAFAFINPALRHLPLERPAAIDAPANEDVSGLREHRKADIGTIQAGVELGLGHPPVFRPDSPRLPVRTSGLPAAALRSLVIAETGASTRPFSGSCAIHTFAASTVTGKA